MTLSTGNRPPNNPIKLTVRPVTHLAVASCAPVRPAAYRVRWAYMKRSLVPLALLFVAGATYAGRLPLKDGRYPGPTIIFSLTEAQKKVIDRDRTCQVEHPNTMNAYTPHIFKLTSSQAKALTAKKGFSPRRFDVYETYREYNEAGPHWNLVLRFSEDEIEVPLDLVVPDYEANASRDKRGWDAFNPCFPELLAP